MSKKKKAENWRESARFAHARIDALQATLAASLANQEEERAAANLATFRRLDAKVWKAFKNDQT